MTTVYVGNLDVNATVRDLHYEFDRYGRISDIWIARNPPGFAFIDFEDDRDARDAVRDMDGRTIRDKRIRVEISRRGRMGRTPGTSGGAGGRASASGGGGGRGGDYRVRVVGLPRGVGWRELKDFIKTVVDPSFADVVSGEAGVVDFSSSRDRDLALARLDGASFQGVSVSLLPVGERGGAAGGGGGERERVYRERSRSRSRSRGGNNYRSRSRDRGGYY
eukprot:gene10058-11129_t